MRSGRVNALFISHIKGEVKKQSADVLDPLSTKMRLHTAGTEKVDWACSSYVCGRPAKKLACRIIRTLYLVRQTSVVEVLLHGWYHCTIGHRKAMVG